MKTKVTILFGGISSEHDISILSAESVMENIDLNLFDVVPVKISKKGDFDQNKALLTDIIFPVLHGAGGEDGTIQAFCENHNKPYVGPGVKASKLALDKITSKKIWKKLKLPIPRFWEFNKADWQKSQSNIIKKFHLPVFVKPANTGSSIGISKVTEKNDIIEAINNALKYDDKIIVEESIENMREIEVAILGNKKLIISPPGEVIPSDEFYSFKAKYKGKSKLIIPAKLTKEKTKEIQSLAKKAYRSLGCQGMSRVDLFLTNNGKIYLNEINTIPGFTKISMYPKLMQAAGISYKNLITKLIKLGLENERK